MPFPNPTSKQTGSCEGSVSRVPKVSHLSGKGLARPPSTLPQHQGHGIINQFQWILTGPEHQEGTGEDKEEVRKGET